MSYTVGQKIWTESIDKENTFLAPAGGVFKASRFNSGVDSGISSIEVLTSGYNDECLLCGEGQTFRANTTYFFHGRIMRMPTNQIFNIQLRVNDDKQPEETDTTTQFIKKIVVAKKEKDKINDWVDVHFLFTPIIDSFNALVFTLARNAEAGDFNADTVRYPSIIYEELSIVKNYMTDAYSFVKVGVQTHPGLELCINGEEITVGRSGIYEVKNDLISVNSFSVISTADEIIDTSIKDELIYRDEKTFEELKEKPIGLEKAQYILALKYWAWDIPWRLKNEVRPYPESARLEDIKRINSTPHAFLTSSDSDSVNATAWKELNENQESPTSECRFGIAKQRLIESFILDYMYKN